MSKRQQKFKRNKRDFYATPPEAVVPLFPHIAGIHRFIEPCVGSGPLVDALWEEMDIVAHSATDIEVDARSADYDTDHAEAFITNPPWTRQILHPIIENLSRQLPTWLLLDADWMHTKQAIPYMARCKKVVSIGRVSWMQNGVSGFDNCCWYLFDREDQTTEFIARLP